MSIIYATDFSVTAHAAGKVAVGLARRLRPSIVLFHTVPASYGWNVEARDAEAEAAQKAQAAVALDATAESLRARGAVVKTELSDGAPAPQILRLGAEHDAEAIVVGSHSRTGMGRLLRGSVVKIATKLSVVEGPGTAQALAQAAARLGAHVVGLATHDRRGLARAPWGSVTEEGLRSSATPALVVHA